MSDERMPTAQANEKARTSAGHPRFNSGLRLGFLSPAKPLTPNSVSGMPWRVRQAMMDRGAEVETLFPGDRHSSPGSAVNSAIRALLGGWARGRDAALGRLENSKRYLEDALPPIGYRRGVRAANRQSMGIRRSLSGQRFDAIFGVCISSLLYALDQDPPIVYFSDATARMIYESYPAHKARSRGYKRAFDEIERVAISKCAAGVFASEAALRSAIDDYGLDPARGHVVPMGANVVPDPGFVVDPRPPVDRVLQLAIVAADPERKRLDLAIECVERLASKGWKARLVYVGPEHPRASESAVVECVGRLRLSEPADRARHTRILADSHLMLLPSVGEAFGIATAEAAHFGRPSVVSDVGGMRTVIHHDTTGLVMPADANASDYADAIDDLMRRPDDYARMCQAALHRARTVLNWTTWADRMVEIIERAARG